MPDEFHGSPSDSPGMPVTHPRTIAEQSPTPTGRSANMRAIKRRDTGPERQLASSLHSLGLRFRRDFLIRLDGRRVRPDIVFTRWRLAVFVDGCFWHSCPEHGRVPSVNRAYWVPKLERTRERDRASDEMLQFHGWRVLHVWEHIPLESATAETLKALEAQGRPSAASRPSPPG